jgi:hypothetical protein
MDNGDQTRVLGLLRASQHAKEIAYNRHPKSGKLLIHAALEGNMQDVACELAKSDRYPGVMQQTDSQGCEPLPICTEISPNFKGFTCTVKQACRYVKPGTSLLLFRAQKPTLHCLWSLIVMACCFFLPFLSVSVCRSACVELLSELRYGCLPQLWSRDPSTRSCVSLYIPIVPLHKSGSLCGVIAIWHAAAACHAAQALVGCMQANSSVHRL